jgi:hypothetical protein
MSCLIVILILCKSVLSIGATEETPFTIAVEVNSSTAVAEEPFVLQAGDSFTVSISIDGNPTFSLVELKLNYDAEALTLATKADGSVDFVAGELFAAKDIYVDAVKPGSIKVLNYNTTDVIKANGSIVTFTFKVNENVHADVAVELVDAIFVNAGFDIFTPAVVANTKEVHVHKITAEPVVEAATCKAPAKTTYTCDTCKEEIVILGTELGEHTFGEWTTTSAPNCTDKGSEERVCTICSEAKETKELEALGHDYSTEWTVDKTETCTTPGSKSHHCSRCDSKTDVTEIAALGHDFGEWTVETAATCTEKGSEKRTCSRNCGESETRAIAAAGHKAVAFEEVAATKEAPGFTGGTYCSECNITLTERVIIPQLKDYTWIYVLVAVVVVVVVAGGVCAFVLSSKKKKA